MKKQLLIKIKEKPYLYFSIKLIAFLILIFSLDYIIGNALRYFYFKQESGEEHRATYVMEQAHQELLVFGSSKASHHYQSEIIENKLDLTTYNAGRNGNPILYHLAIFKSVLKRYKPKQVILDININEFQEIEDSYEVLATLLPYYKIHSQVRPMVKLRSKFEQIKLCSQIYPFNSLIFTIAAGNTEFNKQRREEINGYVPLKNTWKKSLEIEKKQINYVLDTVKVNALKTFIKECKTNNVKLILVFSPDFRKFEETNNSVSIAKKIALENNISFYDFTNDKRFITKPEFFADYTHLNDTGSRYFTNILVDSSLTKTAIK
jgi:hypothetical protein